MENADAERFGSEGFGSHNRSANRILVVIVLFTVILIAVAAYLSSTRETKELSSSSPEGVVQLYLTAITEKKNDLAATYFSSDSTCNADDIDRAYVSQDYRVALVGTELTGDRAYVKVDVNFSTGGPFDSGYTENQTYRLIKNNGIWRITGIPWPLYDCGVINK